MLTGETYLSKGEPSSSPFDSMIDAEIAIYKELPALQYQEQVNRQVESFMPAVQSQLGPLMMDPLKEQFKLDFLARYAVEDYGAQSPAALLNFIMRTMDTARTYFPKYGALDATYKYVLMNRASRDMEEAMR